MGGWCGGSCMGASINLRMQHLYGAEAVVVQALQ